MLLCAGQTGAAWCALGGGEEGGWDRSLAGRCGSGEGGTFPAAGSRGVGGVGGLRWAGQPCRVTASKEWLGAPLGATLGLCQQQ
jgi:hypothetical protein